MTFSFSIPRIGGFRKISLDPGSSAYFCGANGSGKTRLAVYMEDSLGLKAHRISAHRAQQLNPEVAKISERSALAGLKIGVPNPSLSNPKGHRSGNRWRQKPANSLLNDFDFLVQALYAEQANTALKSHTRARAQDFGPVNPTKFEKLCAIWERLLPKRKLLVSGDDIRVSIPDIDATFTASEMSDGERAIFYLVGQVLMADNDSVLIIDEPELHIHRSIMARLWDELEAARLDCAFVFITHDLEFSASRVGQKFVILEYGPAQTWKIEPATDLTGFGKELETLILGSRHRVLFVEGTQSSLDQAIYRWCFPGWLVIPRGSCEDVIHSVATMRKNAALTRLACSGIVDADDRTPEEIERLHRLGIAVLPVAEIENIVLLPAVSRAIAKHEGYADEELEQRLQALQNAVFEHVRNTAGIQSAVIRYCKRRVHRLLRGITLTECSRVEDVTSNYQDQIASVDVAKIAEEAHNQLARAIEDENITDLLSHYDNKGLFALAARHLRSNKADDFRNWLVRALASDSASDVGAAIRSCLPEVPPP